MRVLWICNTVPPECCDLFGFRKRYNEGWITGMLSVVKGYTDIELGLCLPIKNPEKMQDGQTSDFSYYSYLSTSIEEVSDRLIDRFEEIIRNFDPDVVHIWGTEYGHSLAMLKACENIKIWNRAVIHIQGLISAITPYYTIRIPSVWKVHEAENGGTIEEEENRFYERGQNEISIISIAAYAMGRTDWDRSYIASISCNIKYRYCGEILRKGFYNSELVWRRNDCVKHSIFITQGGYAIKGIHLIIPGINLLKRKYDDISINISGTSALAVDYHGKMSPYSEYLLSLMEEYGVKENIHFLGSLSEEEMIDCYRKANVVAIPSTIENSSNSIGEAQLIGVPVVATFTGGTPSLIDNGKTGLMYQMDAPYMFASCIEKIFDDSDFSDLLSFNERSIAKKRYDRQAVSAQLYDIYKEIAEQKEI